MSWDGYIDSVIGHSNGSCDKVAIIGLANGAFWTSSNHANSFDISADERRTIAAAMLCEDVSGFQMNGITIGGLKYQFLKVDFEQGLVLANRKEHGHVTIRKANTVIIIAYTLLYEL